jgi:hypothetical protein|tara:strand:+ start:6897 stop:7280 length:384 start_codon:yes stop_codon:yes gene_type:complete
MDIMKKVKDVFVKKTEEKTTPSSDPKLEALKLEKEKATKDGKPWVAVLNTHINKDNIKNGFFELDWNNEFIEQLVDAGYKGESNEQIVDQWFKTIAKQVLEDSGQDPDRGAGYINTKNLSDDKSEIS